MLYALPVLLHYKCSWFSIVFHGFWHPFLFECGYWFNVGIINISNPFLEPTSLQVSRIPEIRRSRRTCPTVFNNVWQGAPGSSATKYDRRKPEMSDEGPQLRRSKCQTSYKKFSWSLRSKGCTSRTQIKAPSSNLNWSESKSTSIFLHANPNPTQKALNLDSDLNLNSALHITST